MKKYNGSELKAGEWFFDACGVWEYSGRDGERYIFFEIHLDDDGNDHITDKKRILSGSELRFE